jgi:hypothetical protein
MQKKRAGALAEFLTDRFAPEWKLLSETEHFLAHTPDYHQHEREFTMWRERLRQKSAERLDVEAIRGEIVSLRRALRLAGYDLSLGGQKLVVSGWRNDDAAAEGFARAVLCFCDPDVYFRVGQDNHVTIGEALTASLSARRLLRNPELHCVWFRRTSTSLEISGAATETKEAFERLQARAEANPLKILSALKTLN